MGLRPTGLQVLSMPSLDLNKSLGSAPEISAVNGWGERILHVRRKVLEQHHGWQQAAHGDGLHSKSGGREGEVTSFIGGIEIRLAH